MLELGPVSALDFSIICFEVKEIDQNSKNLLILPPVIKFLERND